MGAIFIDLARAGTENNELEVKEVDQCQFAYELPLNTPRINP